MPITIGLGYSSLYKLQRQASGDCKDMIVQTGLARLKPMPDVAA